LKLAIFKMRLHYKRTFDPRRLPMSTSPPPADRNRRAAPRKALRQDATLVYGNGSKAVRTWDLGRDGMCLLSPRPITPGTRCRVSFEVPLGAELIGVTAALKVVYSSYSAAGEFKIGAVFTDLGDDVALVLGKFAAGS
jgi:hypothetical protein